MSNLRPKKWSRSLKIFEQWSLTSEVLKQYLTEKQNGYFRSGCEERVDCISKGGGTMQACAHGWVPNHPGRPLRTGFVALYDENVLALRPRSVNKYLLFIAELTLRSDISSLVNSHAFKTHTQPQIRRESRVFGLK